MKCVEIEPVTCPPRAWRSAVLSIPAITALRTLMSSNGGFVVFSATKRQLPRLTLSLWSL